MTEKDFCEMLEINEPYFSFRGVDYQICAVNGGFLAGEAEREDDDLWFDSKERLLREWTLQGVVFAEALAEIDFS